VRMIKLTACRGGKRDANLKETTNRERTLIEGHSFRRLLMSLSFTAFLDVVPICQAFSTFVPIARLN
jgi:hypothetical protein